MVCSGAALQDGYALIFLRISNTAFSATMTVGIWVFARGTLGMIDESATKSLSAPFTAVLASTTEPSAQVPAGCAIDVADVMRAFRRLAFKTHPDRPGGSHDAFLHTRALLDEALAWMHAGPEVRQPTTWVSQFRCSPPQSSLQSVYA